MKNKLIHSFITILFLFVSFASSGQVITLGTASGFVLFTSNGAVTNTGISQITGNVGSNVGSSTGFGNVNGVMQNNNAVTALCASDLLTAYGQLNTTIPSFFPASPLGNTATLTAGVYSLSANTVLSNTLTLDAAGISSAVFIFQINGTFASNANSVVRLINGALACNVYWKVEGAVSLSSGTQFKGTIVANNAAISISSSVTIEGRALSTTGAISVSDVLAFTPIGCGSPLLTGPVSPTLASTACYALFSSDGAVTNAGVTTVTGDIGSNNGSAVGFNPLLVTGVIHPIPDISTGACAADLGNVYTYLNTLTPDILLLFPAQFGNNLVLTPHTYLMNGAVTLTDSLYLNALGNANAVFVIQVNGAFSTSVNSKIILLNGAQSKNVYWKIDGALSVNGNSIFRGTAVVNNAAIILTTGTFLDGRALTTTGALSTIAMTVTIPSSINTITQPSSQTVCAGSAVDFSVSATGSGLTYQWRKGLVNLINGGAISGATSATLTINPVNSLDAAIDYNVVISGGCSSSFTSNNASLVVNSSPTITAAVPDQTVCAGTPVSFSVNSSGTGLSYQWRNGLVNLINGGNISGATSATLNINPAGISDASVNYNLVITGSCSPNFTSSNITLVVNTSPTITAAVSNQTVCAGTPVSFSVNSSGTGLSYQWRNGLVNLINGGNISGATSATLNINPVGISDASINYNLVITGSCSPNFTSSNITLAVNTSPTITAAVSNQTVCAGTPVSFSVNSSGTGLSYQWRNGLVNLINGGNISGATSATLNINPAGISDASVNYNLVITGSCSPNFTSSNITLVINTSPTITAAVNNQTVCAGTPVSFSVNSSGTGLSYQWRNGIVNLINAGNISGATSATLNINPAGISDASVNYNLVITGSCSPNFTSSNITLVVNTSPTITAAVSNQTVCAGTPVSFSVNSSGTGLSYQWRNGIVNLINAGNISGATSATLNINPAGISDASVNYNLVITGSCSPNFTSSNITLVVNTSPTITAAVSNQTVCAGIPVSFSVNSSGTGLSYQWRNGLVNLINGGNISGATSATLNINPVGISDASINYNLVITGSCSPNFTSSNITLAVNTSPTITAAVSNQTVCAGTPVSFSVNSSGTGLSYQWRNGLVNLINGGNISGATSATLNINPVGISDASINYNLVITGSCSPNFTSSNITLAVNTSPTITAAVSNQTVCAGTPVSFSVNSSGTGLSYQWRNGLVNLINGGNISGATSATLNITPAGISDASINYNLVITGPCSPNFTSNNITLAVSASPTITAAVNNQTVCAGTPVSFSVNSSGTGLSYQWRNGLVNLINGGNISGATSATLNINPAGISDASVNYNLVITGSCSPNFTSSNITLVVNTSPTITAAVSNQTVCAGTPVSFSVNSSGTGLSYQWRNGLVNLINGGNISGATSATLNINPAGISDASNNYNLVITGSCSPNFTSNNTTLAVNASPTITAAVSNQTVCAGTPVSFSVNSSGTGLTYQWKNGLVNLINGGNISGANSTTLTINPVGISDASNNYNLVISGACGSDFTSNNITLGVNTSPTITAAVSNQTVCVGTPVSFSVNSSGTGLSYQWRNGLVNLINGGNISGATSATLNINPAGISDASNNYNLVITGSCSPNFTSNNITLGINTSPTITAAISDQTVCAGSPVSFSVNSSGTGLSYQWRNGLVNLINGGNISGATSATLNINPAGISDASNNYNLVISGACGSDFTSTDVSLSVNNLFVAVAGSNNTVCVGGTILLYAPTITGGIYQWTGPNNYSSANQNPEINQASINQAGTYTLSVSTTTCSSVPSTALVAVLYCEKTEFFIPDGFSPNGDGINDVFVIRTIENYPENSFVVFNRWGNKVFEANPYHNNWDGKVTMGVKIGGDNLPVGTYFYILDLGDRTPVYKGTIYLNR